MAKSDSGLVRLTGLWREETEAGDEYLAGSISPSSRLLIFVNRDKARDSEPDYVAYIAAPQEKQQQTRQGRLWEGPSHG